MGEGEKMKYVFKEVSLNGVKRGKCVVCGKQAVIKRKFFQTINPYNKNKDGLPKTEDEINNELYEEREKWFKEPIKHRKCE
jgi:hypothetical protein